MINAIRYITGRALMDFVSKAMTVPLVVLIVYFAASWHFGTCGGSWLCLAKFSASYLLLCIVIAIIVRPITAGWLFRHARRLVAKANQEWFTTDNRKPVVYLRPFQIDKNADGQLAFHRGAYKSGFSLEECMASAFRKTGPLVALTDPINSIDQVGAARIAAPDETWTTEIRRMIEEASFVLVALDPSESRRSEGLNLEIAFLRELTSPEKIFVYRSFAWGDDGFELAFGVPDQQRPKGSHLVVFDQQWTPRYFPFRALRGLYSLFLDPAINLRRALNKALADREFLPTWTPSALEYCSLLIHLGLTLSGWATYYLAFRYGKTA